MKTISSLLSDYTAYNLWANGRIVSHLNKLDENQLDQEVLSSFPSVRKTLFHLWDAEVIWLNRLKRKSLEQWPSKHNPNANPEESLQASINFHQFVEQQDEQFFNSLSTYHNMSGRAYQQPPWQMVMHCMNHSTYHRGQLVTMLRQLGATDLLATDLVRYFREENG